MYLLARMAGKRKCDAHNVEGRLATASERGRNRASPSCLVKLYEHLTPDQRKVVEDMELGSMLKIKCPTLHNRVINWLASKYDRFSHHFVLPGRGRIPLSAASVYRSMGLPCGELPVTYGLNPSIEKRLRPVLFSDCPNTPHTTKVFTILKEMTTADRNFKQIWIMYLISTVLAPTSLNKVSSRCYPIMDKVDDVKNMNLCQFVCDKLHEELSVGKVSAACLLHMMLLYVDSLDISGLDIVLPEGEFLVNIWSKTDIDTVLDADMKRDLSGFGNLQLKSHLAIDLSFFGGPDGFQGFIDTNTSQNCPKLRKQKVARLVGEFAAGVTRLLGTLVQGWTEVDEDDAVVVEKSFEKFSQKIGVDGTANAGSSIQLNVMVSPVCSKRCDSPNAAVSKHPSGSTSNNVDASEAPVNQATSFASKGNLEQTPPDSHRVYSDHGGLVPSASRVRYNVEDNVDSMDCQIENVSSGRDISDYDDYSDADRFVIKSRTFDAEGKVCMEVFSQDCDMVKQVCGVYGQVSVERKRNDKVYLDDLKPCVVVEQSKVSRDVTIQVNDKHNSSSTQSDGDLIGRTLSELDVKTSDAGRHDGSTVVLHGLAQYNSENSRRENNHVCSVGKARTIHPDSRTCNSQEEIDVDISKKQKKTSPASKLSKVKAKGTRSSPRLRAKDHGKKDNTVEVSQQVVSVAGQICPPAKRRFSARLCLPPLACDGDTAGGEAQTSHVQNVDNIHELKQPLSKKAGNINEEDDCEIIYVTLAVRGDISYSAPSITPGTRLRVGRVIQPSKFLLPHYVQITSTPEQVDLYQQLIKHQSNSKLSKIKSSMFLQISPMWVTTGDLADSVTGELSNTVAEIGISVLQDCCDNKKIIFPWILTVYLLERKFTCRLVQQHFRRDAKYKLSHKDVLLFPVLQNLGTVQKPQGHWYALSLNFNAKRFEVLDSVRGRGDASLIQHASSLIDAIKHAYRVNYSESAKVIENYQLEYIDVPKQENDIDCGFFMLKFLELWDGRVVPAITHDQIPEYRKVLTWTWLNHPRNKFKHWKLFLEANKL